MKQRDPNVIRQELFAAWARGDQEAAARLDAERKAWRPKKPSKAVSPEAKARRRAFARLWG